jgi:hypothetical protein
LYRGNGNKLSSIPYSSLPVIKTLFALSSAPSRTFLSSFFYYTAYICIAIASGLGFLTAAPPALVPDKAPALLDHRKTPEGGFWQATRNLAFLGGDVTLLDGGVFMGLAAIESGVNDVAVEAHLQEKSEKGGARWMAIGIGNPNPSGPAWGEGLCLLVTPQGSYQLCGNADAADVISAKVINLASGQIPTFDAPGGTLLRLEYHRSDNSVTAWANKIKIVDDLKLTDKGFQVNPVFAGFSGYGYQPSQIAITAISIPHPSKVSLIKSAFYMEPIDTPAWIHVGEGIGFKVGGDGIPPELTRLQGVVRDSSDTVVATIIRSREELVRGGWFWQPTEPGYYEVEFTYEDAVGHHAVMPRSYLLHTPSGAARSFERNRQGIAVLPILKTPLPHVGQFGFTYMLDPKTIPLATLVGLDLANIHSISWGAHFTNLNAAIEPTRGQYRWDLIDPHVKALTDAGITIAAQFCYTPLWASPHPDKRDIKICVVNGTSYAPTDINDYGRFVKAVVSRYKDKIKMWELWNEPAIPGGSVFWADTPENFVRMIQSGYTAIKSLQPDSQVWLGGLGPRSEYYAFYNRILTLGAAPFFDVLSVHGASNLEEFRRIEARCGVTPKPAVASEWHGYIQGSMQSTPYLSEPELSLRMMRTLMLQLKQGIQRSVLFEMRNLTEKEALPFAHEKNWFTHSSGLFRYVPQLEPREGAVVMANFLRTTARQATFTKELDLGDHILALLLATGNGSLLALWSEDEEIPFASIAPFISEQSVLSDWEGRILPTTDLLAKSGTSLKARQLYYLSDPAQNEIAKTKEANHLVSPEEAIRKSRATVEGTYNTGHLFSDVTKSEPLHASNMLVNNWKLTKLTKIGPGEGFAAKAAISADDSGVDVVVEVTDAVHCQNELPQSLWNGDSVQIAFDCEGTGVSGGNTELIAALTPSGPVLWKLAAADPRGDIPDRWTPAGQRMKYALVGIDHTGKVTQYQIRIPWSELYPLAYNPAKPLHVSFVINDNDGTGRAGYLEWGEGVAQEKDPSAYGLLKPAPSH